MKRFKYLIAILLFSFSLVVNAEVVTYERTKENYRVPSDIEVNSTNEWNVLNTPSVDQDVKVYDFANLLSDLSFTGIPLIILLFIIVAISTILVPSSTSKWIILSGIVVPVCMAAGISAEYSQVLFRFAESTTVGLTPLFAYYIIYLAYLEKYNQTDKPINMIKSIKYQIPYSVLTFICLLVLAIIWYLTALPIGIHGYPTL